jgi:hypothetical protein
MAPPLRTAPPLLLEEAMTSSATNSRKAILPCARQRRSQARKLSFRTVTTLGFLTITFSMNLLCNDHSQAWFDTSAVSVLNKAGEIIRRPAMMRMNPLVHSTHSTSPLERIGFEDDAIDLDADERSNRFGLATRAHDFSKGADGRRISAVRELARDYSMFIPASLAPVVDAGGVSRQIVDHSISTFFKQDSIRNTFVGRAADTVEKKLKAEVEIGGSEPDSQKHKFKFQVKASETKASMEYRGLTNCNVSYAVASRNANIEIFEPLSSRSNIVYTHTDAPADRRDVLSFRVHW